VQIHRDERGISESLICVEWLKSTSKKVPSTYVNDLLSKTFIRTMNF